MFDHCKNQYSDFEVGKSLQAIVIDWSDAEINGLKAETNWRCHSFEVVKCIGYVLAKE